MVGGLSRQVLRYLALLFMELLVSTGTMNAYTEAMARMINSGDMKITWVLDVDIATSSSSCSRGGSQEKI